MIQRLFLKNKTFLYDYIIKTTMSRKGKGSSAERQLVHKFWETNEWVAHRIAGSGSNKYPSPDIIASNNIRKLVVECKASKDKSVYLTKKEIHELQRFSQMFGAEAWVGLKFDRQEWFFLTTEDLKETPKNFCGSLEICKMKGLLFEELIK